MFLHLQMQAVKSCISKQRALTGSIYLLLVLSGDSCYYRRANRNQRVCKVCLRRDLSKIHSVQKNTVHPGQLLKTNVNSYSVTK